MNLFKCWFLFGFVNVVPSEIVSVCKSVSSSKYHENEGETDCKKSFLFHKEMQNIKEDLGQKGDKGNRGTTGEKGTKGDTGKINMTEIHELKLKLKLGEFYRKNSQ